MTLLAAIVLVAVMTTGCGGSKSVSGDAFSPAVTQYLEKESMGMKVAGYDEVSEDGDKATAMVRLQDAEGMTSIKVKWKFTFSKDADGNWKVDSAQEAK
ncbi:MAG: hypothetical protein ACPGVU_12790 [Limisphaerales bacterium]